MKTLFTISLILSSTLGLSQTVEIGNDSFDIDSISIEKLRSLNFKQSGSVNSSLDSNASNESLYNPFYFSKFKIDIVFESWTNRAGSEFQEFFTTNRKVKIKYEGRTFCTGDKVNLSELLEQGYYLVRDINSCSLVKDNLIIGFKNIPLENQLNNESFEMKIYNIRITND